MAPRILPRTGADKSSDIFLRDAYCTLTDQQKKRRKKRCMVPKDFAAPISEKKSSFLWKGTLQESALLDWLETPGNYELYKGSGKIGIDGKAKISGQKRDTIVQGVLVYISTRVPGGRPLKLKQLKNKLTDLETTWKNAEALIHQTGEGVDERDVQCTNMKSETLGWLIDLASFTNKKHEVWVFGWFIDWHYCSISSICLFS